MTARVSSLKHESIAETLGKEIRSGRLGRQLPGENALAARFAVSRNTVRQALDELGRAGLITTRPGKGSFVVYDDVALDARAGWAVAFEQRGITTEVEVLRLERVTDADLAARLDEEAVEFVAVDRLRRVVGGPAISYERSRVPAVGDLCDLPERGLVGGSLTATLVAAGLRGDHGEQWVSARPLTSAEAAVLGRSPEEWFLQTRRVTRTSGGELVEHVESALDPAHFQLHLTFE